MAIDLVLDGVGHQAQVFLVVRCLLQGHAIGPGAHRGDAAAALRVVVAVCKIFHFCTRDAVVGQQTGLGGTLGRGAQVGGQGVRPHLVARTIHGELTATQLGNGAHTVGAPIADAVAKRHHLGELDLAVIAPAGGEQGGGGETGQREFDVLHGLLRI